MMAVMEIERIESETRVSGQVTARRNSLLAIWAVVPAAVLLLAGRV